MVSAAILSWLRQAGLEKYTNNFGTISENDFLNLAMHEYGKFGITAAEDKQKLFRLLKAVNKEVDNSASNGAAPASQNVGWQGNAMDPGAGLLDLDENDGDLLSHAGFQASPLNRQGDEGLPFNSPDPPKIRVVVRKRPISKKEREKGDEDIVEVNPDKAYVIVNETKVKVDLTKYVEKHQFNFDDALDESVSNETVYKSTVGPLVHTLFKSGKATCFAYGQTGSGKTYTMGPLPVRAAADILQYLTIPQFSDVQLWVSCFEIYGNKAFDLLNQRKKLNILEDGKKKVVVVGLKEYTVESVDYLKRLIDESATKRSTGSTAANSDSSRSHSIMQFVLKRPTSDGEGKQVGKISFIDLAGSERGADTFDNDRQTRLEGAEINKSLLALKECIRALDADARHVPFRGSKLTAVLRDSFLGAQARTVMIACIGPNSSSVEHTLNTLRYADRVKELRKDKAERDPGGVTPGQNPNYYASLVRAEEPPPPPAAVKSSPRRELSPTRVPNGFAPGPSVNAGGRGNGSAGYSYGYMQDDELISARDELMNTILEEEEELITAHRMQIEETMEIVRKEMSLLTEVDQPGSAIDQYVEKLEAILQLKAQGIAELRQKLDSFKQKLREEEIMSRTMGAKRYGQ